MDGVDENLKFVQLPPYMALQYHKSKSKATSDAEVASRFTLFILWSEVQMEALPRLLHLMQSDRYDKDKHQFLTNGSSLQKDAKTLLISNQ